MAWFRPTSTTCQGFKQAGLAVSQLQAEDTAPYKLPVAETVANTVDFGGIRCHLVPVSRGEHWERSFPPELIMLSSTPVASQWQGSSAG